MKDSEIFRENKKLEFKTDASSNSFLKTVSAFSNYGTGRILFGVSDDGDKIGMKDTKGTCLALENKINDSITPHPDFTFSVDSKTSVVELTVYEGKDKPYTYKNKAYKRNDSSTVEVNRIEYNRLILEGQNLDFEETPAKNQNLFFSFFEKKLQKILSVQKCTEDILKTLNLFSDSKGFNVAAELVADENNFPGIDMVRFGKTINEILDRETIEKCSVFQQYDSAVELYKKYYQYEKIDGIERVKVELIPENAFREAVANAIIHRAWDTKSHIRVEFYPDKILISSPGGLPPDVSEKEYLEGRLSLLRNPILGTVFFRLHLIEKFGTGIRRIRASYEKSIVKPTFSVMENSIQVGLPLLSEVPTLSSSEEKIYSELSGGQQLSSSEIAANTGFSKNKVVRVVSGLMEKGYVQQVGAGRGTMYKISE
ncbi:MAG: putative DNA binding domain-containing protein [Treponema sp.]|nr:putative DNA binding domain-containing protein [Treponema sp.]